MKQFIYRKEEKMNREYTNLIEMGKANVKDFAYHLGFKILLINISVGII